MLNSIRFLFIALALAFAGPAKSQDVVLTVSGSVAQTNGEDTWQFELQDLRNLPTAAFETETIWTEGRQVFEGVSLKTLMEHVGASGAEIRATALNDYAVSIPMSDAVDDGPIIAFHLNGQAMSVRDKGPLWIVYPYDGNDAYRSEEYYSRSIWQLDRIEVVR